MQIKRSSRNSNQDKNNSNNSDKLNSPPNTAQKLIKVVGQRGSEKVLYWCKECQKWGDHLTTNHVNTDPEDTTPSAANNASPTETVDDNTVSSESTSYAQMIRASLPSDLGRPDF